MGQNARAQMSHHGALDALERKRPGSVILPIFGSNFSGHGVQNPTRYPRRWPAGESAEGWGVHLNMTADCLDVTKAQRWALDTDADTWTNLWNMEATHEEIVLERLGTREGSMSLIDRLVVNVYVMFHGTLFAPDPKLWAVYVPSAPTHGMVGLLVPRPMTDAAVAEARWRLASKRMNTLRCVL